MKPMYKHTENGTTICTLRDKANNVVYGYAQCHPEEPNPSDRIGEYIATIRAEINYYKLIRRTELRPQMKALEHVYSCIANTGSKVYDKESPEAKLIKREYWRLYNDYQAVGEIIASLEQSLREYLKARENLNSTGQI